MPLFRSAWQHLLTLAKQSPVLYVITAGLRCLCSGLLGNGFLHLLEQAKRNVLQPDTAVVPCGATLYVMGIHVPPTAVASYDMSAMDQYRYGSVSVGTQLHHNSVNIYI